MEVSVFGLLLRSLVPLSSCSYRGSTSCGPSSGKGTTACMWQDMSFRLLNLQKAAFLSPLYSCREFQSKMFLRQHWSISSSAGTSCFVYVVCLQASHCPLLSLPCLEWILLFAPLVSMRSVHEGKCNSPCHPKKPLSNTEFSARLNIKVVSKDENKNFLWLPADFKILLSRHFFQIFDSIWEMYHYEEDLLRQAGVCVSWCRCTERLWVQKAWNILHICLTGWFCF